MHSGKREGRTTFIFDLIIGMLFISGITIATLGLYARRYINRVPIATPYVLLMFCAAAWVVLYALDLLTSSLPIRIEYHNLRFLFLPYFPVLELWLVIAYVKRTEWLRRDWAALILIIPVTATLLALTSPYHDLFRYNFAISTSGPVTVLQYAEGAFFTFYNTYSSILLALAILILMWETRRNQTLWEMQTLLLLFALVFPTFINYLFVTGLTPVPGVNMTPVFLWIPAILFTIALFRYQFLDIVPIARSRMVDALSKPVLVLDMDERIIDMNPAACTLFSVPFSSAMGKPVEKIVPDWPEFLSLCRRETARKKDLPWVRENGTYYYLGSAEPLLTPRGEIEGHLIFLQDITELKNTEKALRESEERFRRLLSGSFDAVIIHQNGRIVLANESAARIIGAASTGDLIGRSVIDLVHPDYRELVATRILDMMRSPERTVPLAEEKFQHFNGTAVIVEVMATATLHEGRPAIIVVFRDITRQKQAEQALRQKTEELNQYFSTSLDLFCIADTDGYFRRLNPEWEKSLGYSLAELEGKRFLDFVHPDDLPATLAAVGELSSQKVIINFTNRYRHRDGTYRWIEWRSFPKGDLIFAAARDITERKRMEDALRDSEEKYRAIINEMQDIFYRTDLAGKITMLSPSAARLAGYDSNDQIIGRAVTSVYTDPAGRDSLLATLRENGSVYAYPLTLKTRDGTIKHVTTSSHFYRDSHGNIQGVEGVIHDISDQQRAEEALRMANKKLNLLSSITRHDIRNQLMALMAFLELSVESINNPAELTEFLKKNQKIADTITQQITFTKEYEDLGVKAPSWQEVDACIDRAVSGLPLKNIRIEKDIAGLEIFADPLVEKVFYNLIDNALRYGGEKMTTIRITSRATGSSLVLIFEDDGVGIDAREKEVIFDRGFGKNTGLGLYLIREILSITGITVAETGKPGNGARFEMTVPEGGFRFI